MSRRHDAARGLLGGIQLIWEGAEPHASIIFSARASGFEMRRDLYVQMDVNMLCRAIASGAESWLSSVGTNRIVQRNLGLLVGIDIRDENGSVQAAIAAAPPTSK